MDGRTFHIPSAPVILETREHTHTRAAVARAYGRKLVRSLRA